MGSVVKKMKKKKKKEKKNDARRTRRPPWTSGAHSPQNSKPRSPLLISLKRI